MKILSPSLSPFYLLFILFFLTACGGGGESIPTVTETTPTEQVDGFIPIAINDTSNDDTNDEIINPTFAKLSSSLNVGFGGAYAFPFTSSVSTDPIWISGIDLILNEQIGTNTQYSKIENFDDASFQELQKYLSKSKYLVYWLSKGWEESWFYIPKIQTAMNQGYIPVFIYWYFGDNLTSVPTGETLQNYYTDNEKVAQFLNELNGTKLVIMEPEFNKNEILDINNSMVEFATILSTSIDTLRKESNQTYFSLCMLDNGRRSENLLDTNCGYANCALGDQFAWNRTAPMYEKLLTKLDFISFQEMVAQFSRNPSNPGDWNNPIPIAYSDESVGINFLSERIVNFTQYLHEKYNKPIFLPYMTIPTATWTDSNNNNGVEEEEVDSEGWEDKAPQIYYELSTLHDTLLENGLFGYAPMALFDNPQHDKNGYKFFMDNEYHLGIVKSSATHESDNYSKGDISFKGNILENIFGSIEE